MTRLKTSAVFIFCLIAGIEGAWTQERTGLRFPYDELVYSTMADYEAVARSAARIYVKVTIRAKAPPRTGRSTHTGNRIISGASGTIMDASGYVVTAAHIAGSTDLEARVQTLDGREYPARIVRVDAGRDVALLKIDGDTVQFPTAEAADELRVDQPVLAIGTPGNKPGVVSVGRVVQPLMHKRVSYGDYGFTNPLLLEMRVEPGHSGGPVVDAKGRLAGMIVGFDLRRNTDGEYVATGAAYAVPVKDLRDLVQRWTGLSGNG